MNAEDRLSEVGGCRLPGTKRRRSVKNLLVLGGSAMCWLTPAVGQVPAGARRVGDVLVDGVHVAAVATEHAQSSTLARRRVAGDTLLRRETGSRLKTRIQDWLSGRGSSGVSGIALYSIAVVSLVLLKRWRSPTALVSSTLIRLLTEASTKIRGCKAKNKTTTRQDRRLPQIWLVCIRPPNSPLKEAQRQ